MAKIKTKQRMPVKLVLYNSVSPTVTTHQYKYKSISCSQTRIQPCFITNNWIHHWHSQLPNINMKNHLSMENKEISELIFNKENFWTFIHHHVILFLSPSSVKIFLAASFQIIVKHLKSGNFSDQQSVDVAELLFYKFCPRILKVNKWIFLCWMKQKCETLLNMTFYTHFIVTRAT